MAEYTFFTNPMSRGQIARWALHEADADYDQVLVDWENPSERLLAVNPMGKVPTIVHHHGDHSHTVSEAAAICHYLAEMHPEMDLLPSAHEKADYFRWLFFAAGPLEQAVTAKAMGWEVPEDRTVMAGFGTYDRTIATLESWLEGRDYVCGSRFTMVDVYLGSHVSWGLEFGTIPDRPALSAYAARCRDRPAFASAKGVDQALIAQAQEDA